jgi:stalled ribosome rescue protein Dom34
VGQKESKPQLEQAMKKRILSMIGLATLLASAHASQEQLAKSIEAARGETAQTSEQLKATLGALNALTKQTKGDLHPAYKAFCDEVAKTQTARDWTVTRVQSMETNGAAYFQQWQSKVDEITNKSLKKKFQKRFDSAKGSYEKVLASLKQAGEKFKPFLSDLGDIQKALATDVTAGGVKAMKSTVSSANWNYQYVDKSITAALKEMDKMAKSLSSEAK